MSPEAPPKSRGWIGKVAGGLVLTCCCGGMLAAGALGPEGINSEEWKRDFGGKARQPEVVVDEVPADAKVIAATPGLPKTMRGLFVTTDRRHQLLLLGEYSSVLPEETDGGGVAGVGAWSVDAGVFTMVPRIPKDAPTHSYAIEAVTLEYETTPGTKKTIEALRLRGSTPGDAGSIDLVFHRP